MPPVVSIIQTPARPLTSPQLDSLRAARAILVMAEQGRIDGFSWSISFDGSLIGEGYSGEMQSNKSLSDAGAIRLLTKQSG